jgi:hypothetical protein
MITSAIAWDNHDRIFIDDSQQFFHQILQCFGLLGPFYDNIDRWGG